MLLQVDEQMEKNMQAIGADIGYNAVKMVNSVTGKRVKFPSVVSLHELVAITQAVNTNRDLIEHNGVSYYYGQDALDMSGKPYRRDSRNYAFTPEWMALFCAGLGELSVPNNASISLVTGLPVDYYDDAEKLRDRLIGVHEYVWKGQRRVVTIERVVVTFQFYGAAMSQLITENAKRITDPHGVAICDGGGRTWNFGVLNQFDVVPGTTFSLDIGTWKRAVEILRPQLVAQFRREFGDTELMSALETGAVWHERENHDVKHLCEEVLYPSAQEIIRTISDKWEQHLQKIGGMFFTGGSPLLMREWLEEAFPFAWFGSEFDNAAGYAWFAGQGQGA